jgi:membrane associated rhomboid family serine protease
MIPLKDDNPTSKMPVVTIALIVINCLVFLYEISLGNRGFSEFTFKYGLIPAELIQGKMPVYRDLYTPPVLDVFASMFMHGGFLHLAGNMLYLWIFGDNIEDTLGHLKFLIFYILSGVAAALSFAFIEPGSTVPMVGASGAISGVLGAYLIRFPQARVYTLIWFLFFIRIVAIPAIFVLGFWFILQVVNGSSAIAYAHESGVAWFAHIGGFVFGLVVFLIFRFGYKR